VKKNAFPQYDLAKKFRSQYPRIELTWISRHMEGHQAVTDVFEYDKDLISVIHPDHKDYLVVDFKELI
jgi:hypothetical protein